MHFTSFSGLGQTCGRECWSRSVYRLVARFDPRFPLLFRVWFCFARSIIIVPFLFFVLRNIDLGVASSSNGRCSPWCQSFELITFSQLRALRCDETVPQYVSSSRDRLNFEWGVLCSESCNGWSSHLVAKKSANNRCNQMVSFVASDAAMYLASVVNTIVPPPKVKI